MKNFSEIKEKAFAIKGDIQIMSGNINGKEFTYTPKIEGYDGYYTVNNSIITFVEGGVQYVIPYTEEIDNILFESDFKETASIYVPFRHGGYPIAEAEKWEQIKASVI